MYDIKISLMFNQYPENDRCGAIDNKFNTSVKQIDSMLLCVFAVIGSLSNYDDDHNGDFKKTIGLMIKTTALHVHHAF